MTQSDCLYSTSVDFLRLFRFSGILNFFKVSRIFKDFLGSLSVRWPDRIVWLQLWRWRQPSRGPELPSQDQQSSFKLSLSSIISSFRPFSPPTFASAMFQLIPSTFPPTTFFADYWRGLTGSGLTASWHCVNLALVSLERSLIAKKDRTNW